MHRAASPSFNPLARAGLLAGAAVIALAAAPALASAASISLGPTAPANGKNVEPRTGKAPVTIDYAVDATGCVNPTVGIAINGPRQFLVPPVALVAPTGAITVPFTRPAGLKKETYTWNAVLNCEGAPVPVPSEERVLTLDPRYGHARLQGSFLFRMTRGKTKKLWASPFRVTYKPKCKTGACVATRDSDRDNWRYNARTRKYVMRTKSRRACEGNKGRVSGGTTEVYTFVLKPKRTTFARKQRFAKTLIGTWTYNEVLTPKGRRAGCYSFKTNGRISAKLKGKIPRR